MNMTRKQVNKSHGSRQGIFSSFFIDGITYWNLCVGLT